MVRSMAGESPGGGGVKGNLGKSGEGWWSFFLGR
jgi:hypothetical protein